MNFIQRNFGLKVTALAIGVILWFTFSHLSVPQVTFTKTLVLPLKIQGVGAGLVSNARVNSITVELAGPRTRLDPLNPDQFLASVDARGKGPGALTLSVKIDGPAVDAVRSVNPGQVIVVVDHYAYRSVPVVADQSAQKAAAALQFQPITVTVAGAQAQVTKVMAASVSLPESDASRSGAVDAKPVPVDMELAPVSGLAVAPPLVRVTLTARKATAQ